MVVVSGKERVSPKVESSSPGFLHCLSRQTPNAICTLGLLGDFCRDYITCIGRPIREVVVTHGLHISPSRFSVFLT